MRFKSKTFFQSVFASILIILSSSEGLADGNKLLSQCLDAEYFLDTEKLRNEMNVAFCIGIVQGVGNTMQILNPGLEINLRTCFPKSWIGNSQAIRIVIKYLKENPQSLHENEVFLIMRAFTNAYQCK